MDMRAVESALKLYKLDNGFYPTTEQGLRALMTKSESKPSPRNFRAGGYLDASEVPQDPWGHEFIYRSPGDSGRDYEIISLGADGTEGGTGVSADIKNWELK
jgi:general secretion pathway protein G